MSVCYSAELIYGVLLTPDEVEALQSNTDLYDEFCNKGFVRNSNYYDNTGDIIIGIVEDSIDCGESTELGTIHDPRTKDIDELLSILDAINIDREPTWHLMCSVS